MLGFIVGLVELLDVYAGLLRVLESTSLASHDRRRVFFIRLFVLGTAAGLSIVDNLDFCNGQLRN